ncbi:MULTISPECIES: hypothetical protein [unclassified Arthrobacter]|uniref:hypothetical protein n=1 Tax=unclassified Arthrobacter TaxID=235627 RepID=UPI0033997B5E
MSADALTSGGPVPSVGRDRQYVRKVPTKQLLGLAGIVGFLGTWELIPRLGIINERFLPPAGDVIVALVRDVGLTAFWISVGETMTAWFLGLVIAVALAGSGLLPQWRWSWPSRRNW